MHRAFYAIPLLTNSKGLYTNAVYGFMNMFFKLLDDYSPHSISVAFDRKAPTFRHIEYSEYKAGRKKMPEELIPQFDLIKKVLETMEVPIYEIDGYEADDILGTAAKYGDEKGLETLLVTGDRDALQLISQHTHVLITKTGTSDADEYDERKVMERYGLLPDQIIDLKGLMGDASDNIPGVPGIGEKTALKLLKEYGSVEKVLEHASEIKGNKLRERLIEYADQALFSKKLATICKDVPIEFHIEEDRYEIPDYDKLVAVMEDLEFKSLLKRIAKDKKSNKKETHSLSPTANIPSKSIIVSTVEELDTIIQKMQLYRKFSFLFEDNLSIAFSEGEEYVIRYRGDLIDEGIGYEEMLQRMMPIWEDEDVEKITHDGKKAILLLNKKEISLKNLSFDTMIASYLLNPSGTSYEPVKLIKEMLGIDKEKAGAADLWGLKKVMEQKMKELQLEQLYREVELPLVSVLADMEMEGFTVDVNVLDQLGKEYGETLERLTNEIYEIAGEEFNINSTKQLGNILFDKLKLPVIKKTKTGYSTDVEVLEQLEPYHIIIKKIMEYRQIMKLKSTYIDGLLHVIDPRTHKIHSSFNQTVTATGRISSTEPNLQNIPVKTELGKEIRKVFTASGPDYVLVDADYSQIELRVLAHISNDPGLIDAFERNQDIHQRTASEVFNVPMDEVSPFMRSSAKAVNFGIVYGISDFGLSKNLNISRKEAANYIEKYLGKYQGVKKYMENIVALGKKQGYVTTLLNRRRYLPELSSKNYNIRSFGERVAMNTPIQGTAADIIKMAMIAVNNELKKRKLRSKLILQVHDELIVNAHRDEVEEVKSLVKEKMESVIKLKVPLVVDVGEGYNWYDAK